MGIYSDLLGEIQRRINNKEAQSDIAQACNVQPMYVHRLLHGKRSKNSQKLFGFIESLGGKIVFSKDDAETTKSVYFVKPKIVSSAPDCGLVDENYIAVPLASMPVAAGQGIIPEEKIKSWVLVWTGQEAVRHRSNLVAVEVGMGQRSMEPTLHPGDIVLVDRNDRIPQGRQGNIYLVRAPSSDEAGLAIKRVALQKKNSHDLVVFYSDNNEFAPEVYSLDSDYNDDIRQAVLGRVIWSWSDMSKK